jgi:general secretion pathway protein G
MTARNRRSSAGFTLIELVITVAIIGLLAGMATPMWQLEVKRHKEEELRVALRDIRKAIDAYKDAYDRGHIVNIVGQSGYPPDLRVLVDGVTDAQDPDQHKIYFLRRIPRDPFSTDSSVPPEETWGLRSYESDADNPTEGDDVYDVYSRSTGVGLNKVPYRQW